MAIARNLLSERFSDYFPHLDNEFVQADNILSSVAQESGFYGGMNGFSYLYDYLNRLKTFHYISICGITMRQYTSMERVLPEVFVPDAGIQRATVAFSSKVDISSESINRIIGIIITCSLKVAQINPENQ